MKKDNQDIRAFIDLKIQGNANGGMFMKNKRLHDKIKEIESTGIYRVVGIVYDETDDIEIITKSVQELEDMKTNPLLQ